MTEGIEVAKWFDPETGKGYVVYEFSKLDYEKYLIECEEMEE